MDQRPAHRVTILGAEAQFAKELKAALRRDDGQSGFTVSLRRCLQGLDPRTCELLILDVDGQAGRRLEWLARCRGLYPCLPVVMLVGRGDMATAVAAMKAGAADCLEKPVEADRLWSVVTGVLGNGRLCGRRGHKALSETETRVLHLLMAGKTNLEIAEQFHRSRRTIEVHRMNIMRKLGVSCVADLVRQAIELGLIIEDPAAGRT